MQFAIEAYNLVKHYGTLKALDQVSLSVRRGEIFGFLGPNGAGKSTFVKIMLNLINPSAGSTKIFGESSKNVLSRKNVGFLPENIKTYGFLKIDEFIAFHAQLSEMPKQNIKSEIERCIAKVGLKGERKRKLGTLSKGMMQRVGIAQAIIGQPELLILDEPTSGLDPIGFTELRNMLLEMNHMGTTIFLNSHLLSEVERTCDRIAILHKGKIIKIGDKKDISDKEKHLEIVVEGLTDNMVKCITALTKRQVELSDNTLKVFPSNENDPLTIHKIITDQGGKLLSFLWKAESLEELFYRLVKHEDDDDSKNRY